MEIKILLLVTILLYSIIASQSFSYMISLSDVQKNMTLAEYISFRKCTDKNYRAKFGKLMYGALIANMLLLIVCIFTASFGLAIAAGIAFILLSADSFIAVKYNVPINAMVNEWTTDGYPVNWTQYRQQWLQAFCKRQVINLSGFTILVSGAIFY